MRSRQIAQLKKKYSGRHPWRTADVLPRSVTWPQRPSLYQFDGSWWFYSPESYLRLRRLGPALKGWYANKKVQQLSNADQFRVIFGEWLKQHLSDTLKNKRKALGLAQDERCLRWVFSENDQIPGLIVDIFGTTLVAQLNSAPIELVWPTLRAVLIEVYEQHFIETPRVIELRNSPARKKEGLDVIEPEPRQPQTFLWNHFFWTFTPGGQQKTGAYFDQRQNHVRVAELANQKGYQTAWDLCCYQGGFALHLVKNGLHVTGLDQSAAALSTARENISRNELDPQLFESECADVFEWLKSQSQNLSSRPDLVILDPPSFVKTRNEISTALRGYLELNTLALRSLKSGGALVSCVCSHHISVKDYENVLHEAARAAGRMIRHQEMFGPSPDHVPALDFPEGRYLQAWILDID